MPISKYPRNPSSPQPSVCRRPTLPDIRSLRKRNGVECVHAFSVSGARSSSRPPDSEQCFVSESVVNSGIPVKNLISRTSRCVLRTECCDFGWLILIHFGYLKRFVQYADSPVHGARLSADYWRRSVRVRRIGVPHRDFTADSGNWLSDQRGVLACK